MGKKMSTRSNTRCIAVGILCVAVLVAGRLSAAPLPRLQPGDALIENSGSTNTSGYMIYVSPSGRAQFATYGGSTSTDVHFTTAKLGKEQVNSLFHSLAAAMPLSSLPAGHGMRSVSFGTRTFVTYRGQTSPDLTFAGDPRVVALKSDVAAIADALHLRNLPRHRVTP